MNRLILATLLVVFASSTAASSVRQCTCKEIDSCESQLIQRLRPCANQCLSLSGANIDLKVLQQCVGEELRDECFTTVKHTMCTDREGVMIDDSETFAGPSFLRDDPIPPVTRRTRQPFQDTSVHFAVCMLGCAYDNRARLDPRGCTKSFDCAVRMPPPPALVHAIGTCRQQFNAIYNSVCWCLKNAGVRPPMC